MLEPENLKCSFTFVSGDHSGIYHDGDHLQAVSRAFSTQVRNAIDSHCAPVCSSFVLSKIQIQNTYPEQRYEIQIAPWSLQQCV